MKSFSQWSAFDMGVELVPVHEESVPVPNDVLREKP